MPVGVVSFSARKSEAPPRTGARPSGRSPTRRRAAPVASCPRIVSAPGKAAGALAAGAARLRDRPFQRRLDRRRRLIEIGAVQAEARLEPQAVARAEADRRDRGIAQQRLAQRLGRLAPAR